MTLEGKTLPPLEEETPFEQPNEELSSVRTSIIQQESQADMRDSKKIFNRKNAPAELNPLSGKKYTTNKEDSLKQSQTSIPKTRVPVI